MQAQRRTPTEFPFETGGCTYPDLVFLADPPIPVHVVHDGWDVAALMAGLGGLAIAVAAFWFALRAKKDAEATVASERNRVFQLEVLRQLIHELDETEIVSEALEAPRKLARFSLRIGLLDKSLPAWEQVMLLDDRQTVMTFLAMGTEHALWLDAGTRRREARDRERRARSFAEKLRAGFDANEETLRMEKIEAGAKKQLMTRLSSDLRDAVDVQVLAGNVPRLCWRCTHWWYGV